MSSRRPSLVLVPSPAEEAARPRNVTELFRAHAPFLLRTVERLSGRGPHVEEIVQEAFIVAHKRWDEVVTLDNPRGWLFRVAQNLSLHHHRSTGRQARLEQRLHTHRAPPSSGEGNPELSEARRERAELVREVVMSLPEKQRTVLVLFEFEGLKLREISELLEVPEKTVSSRLRLAREGFEVRFRERSSDSDAEHEGGDAP